MLTVMTFLYDKDHLPFYIPSKTYGLAMAKFFKLNHSSIESSLKIAQVTGGTFFYNSLN